MNEAKPQNNYIRISGVRIEVTAFVKTTELLHKLEPDTPSPHAYYLHLQARIYVYVLDLSEIRFAATVSSHYDPQNVKSLSHEDLCLLRCDTVLSNKLPSW
jgi:hypothetical protein